MDDRETRRYEMLGRADTFGKDNAADSLLPIESIPFSAFSRKSLSLAWTLFSLTWVSIERGMLSVKPLPNSQNIFRQI